MAQFGRFLMGAGSACAYLSTAKVTAEWFPASKFALITCITQGMGTIGGTFGGRPFAIIVNQFGWRNAMIIAAVAGAGVTLSAWFIIRDKHETASKQQPHEKVEHTFLGGLKVITRNPQCWLVGLYGCFMYLPLSAFAELWAVPYLMQSQGINNEIAAMASIMVFIGVAVGAPSGAWLSDQLQSRLKVMRLSALFVIVVYVPDLPLSVVLGLLFVSGVVAGGQVLYFAAAKEINPPQISATTIGFTNSLVMLSGIVFQPLLGFLLDFVWDGKRGLDGLPMYTTHDYQIALSPVPFFLFVSWLILKFVKETYPKD
jgi:sugar phosphate permease